MGKERDGGREILNTVVNSEFRAKPQGRLPD